MSGHKKPNRGNPIRTICRSSATICVSPPSHNGRGRISMVSFGKIKKVPAHIGFSRKKTGRKQSAGRLLQKSILHPGIGHTHPVRFRQAGFQNIAVGAGTFMCSDFALANMAWRISQTVTQAVKFGFLFRRHAKHVMHRLTSDGAERNFFGAASAFYSTGSKP